MEKYEKKVSQLKALLEERDGEVVALKQKIAMQRREVAHLTDDLTQNSEQLENALIEHTTYVRVAHESCRELLKKAEEEKELAVTEARSATVEEFNGGPTFEELLREKSEWALMELTGAILGEFKEQNPHVDF